MADQGDLELFTGPAPSEKKEMSDEQFRDEMKKTQQALQQLKKEEGKVKAQDNHLAHAIVRFLGQSQHTDLFLLISRVVAINIPSELILAIIALVDKKTSEEIRAFLKAGEKSAVPASQPAAEGHGGADEELLSQKTALTVSERQGFESLPLEQKKEIDEWIGNIHQISAKQPHRILENILIKKPSQSPQATGVVKEIALPVIQLSTVILRNYLTQKSVSFEFENLYDFMQAVFVKLVQVLEKQVAEQKQLKKSSHINLQ